MTAATEEDPAVGVGRDVRSVARVTSGALLRKTRAELVRLARLARNRRPTASQSSEALV